MDNETVVAHDPDVTTLADSQENLLSILGLITGCMSMLGSTLIASRVWRNYRKHTTTPYERMMGALSCCDVVSSFAFGFAPLLLPKDTSPRAWASGNEMTCNMLGFLTQFSFAAVWCVLESDYDL